MFFKAIHSLEPISSGGPISIVDGLIATSYDDSIVVSRIDSGEILHKFEGDGESVSALELSKDKTLLVVASRSLQVHVYSLESGELLKSFPKAHESAIMSVTIDPTSSLAATGGAEGAVKVWDLKKLILTHNFRGHGGIVSSLAFFGELGSTDWKLASGSDNGKLLVWNLVKSNMLANLENHSAAITSIQWTSKGDSLISGGRDKIVTVWPKLRLGATIPIKEEVESVGFIEQNIYTGSPQNVRVWTLNMELLIQWDLDSDESEIVSVIRQSGDSPNLFVILSDQTVIELVFDSESKILSETRRLSTNHGEIIDVLTLADSNEVVLATNSKDLRLVDLEKNLLEFKPLIGHTDIVIAIDVLGQWLLSGGKDKEARLWDLKTGKCMMTFTGHTGAIGAVALSRGNNNVPQFVLTGSEDLTVKKWGPDGTADYTRKAHDKDINAIDVSASNLHFATGSQDRTIKVWSVASGEVVGLLKGHKRGVWSVRFAPQNTLISGGGDKTLRLWSLNDFTCLRTFEGHIGSVLKVISLDTQHIASAGGDGLIKVWDTRTNEEAATLDGHEGKVWSLTKKEDGTLISGGGDGVLKVWQDYTEEEQIRLEKEEEEALIDQQELDNSVRANEWDKAIKLALKLNKPLKLLKLFTDVSRESEPGSISGKKAVDHALQDLEGKDFIKLLERLRDWNTSGKTSVTAQKILSILLTSPNAHEKFQRSSVLQLLQGIMPYTQRHLGRVEEMLEATYVVDYTLKEMSL